DSQLFAVAALSRTSAWATGTYEGLVPLIERWDGVHWTAMRSRLRSHLTSPAALYEVVAVDPATPGRSVTHSTWPHSSSKGTGPAGAGCEAGTRDSKRRACRWSGGVSGIRNLTVLDLSAERDRREVPATAPIQRPDNSDRCPCQREPHDARSGLEWQRDLA